jgi:photosystem II stability/assembly factor-like uncharacterized protein
LPATGILTGRFGHWELVILWDLGIWELGFRESRFALRYALVILALLAANTLAHAGSLHNVQFIDAKEGWAVGDDGVILHSLDGGKSWESQNSGTKASLRGIYFFDELIGWVVGREERPYGGGSVGVVLFTRDGGNKWHRQLDNSLPGLNAVRFTDRATGFMMGDGQVPFTSGIFRTDDGGKSWEPVRGVRAASWAAGDFQDGKNGVLVGPAGKLATLRNNQWAVADPESFKGRGIRAVQILHKKLLAVGEGGLVLTSQSGGQSWGHADIGLPPEARTCLDFNCIASFENRVWIAGRPGSVILRSDDNGATWTACKVKDGAVAIRGLHFVDRNNGWAVGVGGRILKTSDGGNTWNITHDGEGSYETLFVNARAKDVPFDAIATECAAARNSATVVVTSDPAANSLSACRMDRAARLAGGDCGEELTAFPLPSFLQSCGSERIINVWNAAHAGRAPQELLRHLVLTLRLYQPQSVIVDDQHGHAVGAIIAEAVTEAAKRAGDPKQFPEQLEILGLGVCDKMIVETCTENGSRRLSTGLRSEHIDTTPRDRGIVAVALVADRPIEFPFDRKFETMAAIEGMGEVKKSEPSARVVSRSIAIRERASGSREWKHPGASEKIERTTRQLVNLVDRLPRSEIVLTQLVPLLKSLPDDDAAKAAFNVAWAYVRMGEWDLARETFLVMVDRSPTHPLSAEAYRWLIQHNASGEVRRRHELKQFALVQPEFGPGFAKKKKADIIQASAEEPIAELLPPLAAQEETRQWNRGTGEFAKRLALFGSMTSNDPRVQFSLQSARRALGETGTSRAWHERFAAQVGKSVWGDAAAMELWASGTGPKPAKIAGCRLTDDRPNLDGKLDDACWTTQPAMALANAAGTSQIEYPTQAWMAYDAEFLYIAVRCKHPAGKSVPPIKVRQRDANLDAHDRVSLLLDIDRDFATYYRFEFDQRGCVREDFWGDANWNPKWYVAVNSTDDSWCVEAAIPLGELTSSPITLDTRWACNLVRIVPGQGVQSVSQPADVEPRPEGMCGMYFHQDARRQAPPMPPAP